MSEQAERAERFLALHEGERPLLLPNPWDRGSAKLLASLGFEALATTSSGSAATLGRLDGSVTREEAIASAAAIVEATDLPVSADLENGFADDPAGVAETIRLALDAGLAGASIEDYSGREDDADLRASALAAERVAAAAEAAHGGPVRLVLTARAENHLHGVDRPRRHDRPPAGLPGGGRRRPLRPGPAAASRTSARSSPRSTGPSTSSACPGVPSVAELAAVGVRRVSVGGAFAFAALGAVVEAARELLDEGTYGYFERTGSAWSAARPLPRQPRARDRR